jgi:hypothetical protein
MKYRVRYETYSCLAEGAWSETFQTKRKAMKAIRKFLGDMKPIELIDRSGEWFTGMKRYDNRVDLYAGLFILPDEL